jgi:hypothetical protein
MEQVKQYKDEIARLNKIIEQKDAIITRHSVENYVLEFLDKWGYVLSDDPVIRSTYMDMLFEKLEDNNTKIKVDGGKIIVLDAVGGIKENETGTADLTFDALLASKANRIFPKAAPGTKQAPAKTNYNVNDLPLIQTREDFYHAINNERDPTRALAIREHFAKMVEIGEVTE